MTVVVVIVVEALAASHCCSFWSVVAIAVALAVGFRRSCLVLHDLRGVGTDFFLPAHYRTSSKSLEGADQLQQLSGMIGSRLPPRGRPRG